MKKRSIFSRERREQSAPRNRTTYVGMHIRLRAATKWETSRPRTIKRRHRVYICIDQPIPKDFDASTLPIEMGAIFIFLRLI